MRGRVASQSALFRAPGQSQQRLLLSRALIAPLHQLLHRAQLRPLVRAVSRFRRLRVAQSQQVVSRFLRLLVQLTLLDVPPRVVVQVVRAQVADLEDSVVRVQVVVRVVLEDLVAQVVVRVAAPVLVVVQAGSVARRGVQSDVVVVTRTSCSRSISNLPTVLLRFQMARS